MDPRSVFLNIPYDKEFEPLFLAYIVGVIGFGLVPRASLENEGATHRIDHIVELIHESDWSIHDMSRDSVPRFNMPFELGLAYHHALSGSHTCLIFSRNYNSFETSLSDLKGIDIHQHRDEVDQVFSRLCAAFDTQDLKPTVSDMKAVYELLKDRAPEILADFGSESHLHASVFSELVFTARAFWASRQVRRRSNQA